MNDTRLASYKCLSGFWLKRIAVISMIIDHFNSIIMDGIKAPYITDGYLYIDASYPWIIRNSPQIDIVCDILGSIAMPIFCFLIAEGFLHTRSRLKYGLTLGAFALISELPYNIAHYQRYFNYALQNVIFTLCIGFFTIWALDYIAGRFAGRKSACIALSAAAVIAGAGLAFLLRGEYVFLGIASIALFYLLRDKGLWRLCGVLPLLPASWAVLLAAVPIFLYNNSRGRGSKYFFYIFYPAHFLLFAGIAYLLARA